MTIQDKGTFKRLSARGLLGNTFQQWDTAKALWSSGYHGWLTVRAVRPGDKHLFVPCILRADLGHWLDMNFWTCGHSPDGLVYFQECPGPDTQRIINLEAGHLDTGLYVRYALDDPTNLRHSLEQRGQDAEGLTALLTLQRYVPAEDLDTMRGLWDLYPGSIIEASVFSRACGIQGRKTIIWEVRNY